MTLRRGLAALGVVLVAGLLAALAVLRASLPQREGELRSAALAAAVEVRFDARARPYVRAGSFADALFAQGVLHARERLFQMELLRRAGRGRLAEALGAGLLDSDVELWRSGVPQLAARLEANARPETLVLVERYVAGVNAALAALPVRPPDLLLAAIEVRPWEPRDVFAVGALMAFDSARNRSDEQLRWALSQALSPAELAAFLPDETAIPDFPWVVSAEAAARTLRRGDALDAAQRAGLPSASLGSNGWAVAPGRARGGHALFAFDSHDALALPNLFYEVHLFFRDGAEPAQVRGWGVAGLPGVINGFNEGAAWGLTNIGDTQDLFLEVRHPEDPLRFRDGAAWKVARRERVEIPVRGRAEPERIEILHTHHGPLVVDDPPLALAWTAHRIGDRGLDALLALNRATRCAALDRALDDFAAPSTNLSCADVDGHVSVRTAGLLPRRGRGSGLLPQRGDDPAAAWQGLVPVDAQPRSVDPASGFAAAANARVSPPGAGPLVSAENAPGYRMGRIRDVLAARRDHDVASMQALQMDWHNGQAERVLPALLAGLDKGLLEGRGSEARRLLEAWRAAPVNAPESAAALVFERWYLALAHELFAERLGEELFARLLRRNYLMNHAVDGLLLADEASPWWRGERSARIRAAFAAAVDGLAAELGSGPSAWRWDALQAVHLEHELAKAVPWLGAWLSRGPRPWGGGAATVGRAAHRYDRPHFVNRAATVRVVAELSRPPRVLAVIPGGQSGHPLDRHYADQLDAWLAGALEPLAQRFEELPPGGLRLLPASGAR